MVYIYKKKSGEKNYYYLRASQKKGKKTIVKDIAYLGTTIEEVEQAIIKLPKWEKEIRKAYHTINNFLKSNHYKEKAKKEKRKKDEYLEQDLLLEIEATKIHFQSVFKKKNTLTQKETIKIFTIEFAFNTTSLEGNTIKLQEAKILLEEGLTPKNKTLREVYDLQNTEEVLVEVISDKEDLSHEKIQDIHLKLMKNIDERKGYRREEVRVFKSNFDASPAPYVKTDMDLLLKWYNENKKKLHPLILAGIFHHKFEKIHPFMDGNGRTGRMLLNKILLLNEYPPLIIRKKERKGYIQALREADKSNPLERERKNYASLNQFLGKELISSYWDIFL
ncbi:MAG: Fic family protein [bacterium]|nr:Fic family protein [bacterium]